MTAHASQDPTAELRDRTIHPVLALRGDASGAEALSACARIMEAARAPVVLHTVGTGATPEAITARMAETGARAILKAPGAERHQFGVEESARQALGVYADVTPCVSYAPVLRGGCEGLDLVVIRAAEHAPVESRLDADIAVLSRHVDRAGADAAARIALEFAQAAGRTRIDCLLREDVAPATDGFYREAFDRLAEDFGEIDVRVRPAPEGLSELARDPASFDVVFAPPGVAEVAAAIAANAAGPATLAPTSSLGRRGGLYAAAFGAGPQACAVGLANPSGLLLACVTMLLELGEARAAETIHNAWLRTLEDGVRTSDMCGALFFGRPTDTEGFTDAVIARLGRRPSRLAPAVYRENAEAGFDEPPPARPAGETPTAGWDVTLLARPGGRGPTGADRVFEAARDIVVARFQKTRETGGLVDLVARLEREGWRVLETRTLPAAEADSRLRGEIEA